MSFDYLTFLAVSGWIFGLVSLAIAVKEHLDKVGVQKTVEELKKSEFLESIRKTTYSLFPDLKEFKWVKTVQEVSAKYLLDYLKATATGDSTSLLNIWQKAGVALGESAQRNANQSGVSVPSGLAECIAFMFVSHFSRNRGKEYLDSLSKSQKYRTDDLVRYYLAFRESPVSLKQLVEASHSFSSEQLRFTTASLKGEELSRIAELLESQKWGRRMVERMRDIMRVRQISYQSLATKVVETNPLPKLFILFKNEGREETGDETETTRVVQGILHDLKEKGKVELIAPLAPVYFMRDKKTVEEILSRLPEGEENNYIVFTAAIDPLAVNMKTSDRLEGKPMMLYENLIRFRSEREVYESILLRLGVRPSDIIETADIGFLVEPKSDQLMDALRANSSRILEKLGDFAKRKFGLLTDLRSLDEDDIGYLGTLVAEATSLSETDGRKIAEQVVRESRELYNAIYEPIQ